MLKKSGHLELADQITIHFAKLGSVEAVVLGGSLTGQTIDNHSDIDVYVYSDKSIPLNFRKDVTLKLGTGESNIGLCFWDDGDEWIHKESSIEVDMIYWNRNWIEEHLQNILGKYQANIGYTTCYWHTIFNSKILFDRSGWFTRLRSKYNIPYPKDLKRNIIRKNYPILKNIIPSYYKQMKKAIDRNDLLSINHRIAAFFASYFDIIFALNEIPHPGEKKIIAFVENNCSKIPPSMAEKIRNILNNSAEILLNLDGLISGLDELLIHEGFRTEKLDWNNL